MAPRTGNLAASGSSSLAPAALTIGREAMAAWVRTFWPQCPLETATETQLRTAIERIESLRRCLQQNGGEPPLGPPADWKLAPPLLTAAEMAMAERQAEGGPLACYLEEQLRRRDDQRRRRLGAYYTPYPLAEYLVHAVKTFHRDAGHPRLQVVDPSCGSGVFLAAAHEQLGAVGLRGIECDWPTAAVAAWLLQRKSVQVEVCDALRCESPLTDNDDTLAIIGNPPYSNFGRRDRGGFSDRLLATYKAGLQERKHNLGDDYIRFIRWSQYQVEQAGRSIVALVVNHSFLTGVTHRIMRSSLMETFDDIEVVDLGGQANRRGDHNSCSDENVFGIRTGVTLLIMRRTANQTVNHVCRLRHTRLSGNRESKFATLTRSIREGRALTREIEPAAPAYFFGGSLEPSAIDVASPADNPQNPTLDKAVNSFTSGVQTKCDALFVDLDRQRLATRMRRWFEDDVTSFATPDWLREKRVGSQFDASLIRPYMTAPLDRRYVYYDPRLLGRARFQGLRWLIESKGVVNPCGLVFMRQSHNAGEYDHFLVTDCLVSDRVFYSPRGAPFIAPIRCAQCEPNTTTLSLPTDTAWQPLRQRSEIEIWSYYYALFHSGDYRERYAKQLQSGFPPLPPPRSATLVEPLIEIGRGLIATHLAAGANVERDPPGDDSTDRAPQVGRTEYDTSDGAIRLGQHTSVPAPPEILQWRIGGYRVVHRWLKQRAKERCTDDFLASLQLRIEGCRRHHALVEQLNELF